MKALAAQGINVARRTIAKYREQLNILPSHLRKTY
jgi:RNA polymerase sigma-54 factor